MENLTRDDLNAWEASQLVQQIGNRPALVPDYCGPDVIPASVALRAAELAALSAPGYPCASLSSSCSA
jgi:hypothetical protein